MSQFRQGLKFRNADWKTPSTDFIVVTVDLLAADYVDLTVMFVEPTTGKPMKREPITIVQENFNDWKQVVEES